MIATKTKGGLPVIILIIFCQSFLEGRNPCWTFLAWTSSSWYEVVPEVHSGIRKVSGTRFEIRSHTFSFHISSLYLKTISRTELTVHQRSRIAFGSQHGISATWRFTRGCPTPFYYNRFSICSIMMRHLSAIRGDPKDAASAMDIAEQGNQYLWSRTVLRGLLVWSEPEWTSGTP